MTLEQKYKVAIKALERIRDTTPKTLEKYLLKVDAIACETLAKLDE